MRAWKSKTPDDFRFTLKLTREYVDPKKPIDPQKLREFTETAKLLGDKLGPILLQFSPWVKPGRATYYLTELLDALDPSLRYAVELRDAGWFEPVRLEALCSDLSRRKIALAWSYLTYVDVPPELTTDFVYLRFIGDHTRPTGRDARGGTDRPVDRDASLGRPPEGTHARDREGVRLLQQPLRRLRPSVRQPIPGGDGPPRRRSVAGAGDGRPDSSSLEQAPSSRNAW